jgi:predicted amidohydrolase YtcJ
VDRFPEQRLTRLEALRGISLLYSINFFILTNLQGITIDPAYASFTESVLGSLEPGKIADYVVLSQDIMVVPEDQLLATKVTATVIDGAVVFGKI